MPTTPNQKVQIIDVLKNYAVTTRTLTATASSGDLIELNITDAELWGPYLTSIIAHTRTANVPDTHFQWTVLVYTSLDGTNWTLFGSNLFNPLGATTGDAVSAAFTSNSNPTAFAMHMKYVLAVWYTTGGTAPVLGTISLSLEFDFKS